MRKVKIDLEWHYTAFRSRLKKRRAELGFTHQQMTDVAGLWKDNAKISKLELGYHRPCLQYLTVLAGIMFVSLDWLMGLTDKKTITLSSFPDDWEEILRDNLKKLQLDNNLTNYQLAARIGVSAKTISNIYCKKYNPSFDNLIKFSRVFKVSTDKLLGRK